MVIVTTTHTWISPNTQNHSVEIRAWLNCGCKSVQWLPRTTATTNKTESNEPHRQTQQTQTPMAGRYRSLRKRLSVQKMGMQHERNAAANTSGSPQRVVLLLVAIGLVAGLLLLRGGIESETPMEQLARRSLEPDAALTNGRPTILSLRTGAGVPRDGSAMLELEQTHANQLDVVLVNVDNPRWGDLVIVTTSTAFPSSILRQTWQPGTLDRPATTARTGGTQPGLDHWSALPLCAALERSADSRMSKLRATTGEGFARSWMSSRAISSVLVLTP